MRSYLHLTCLLLPALICFAGCDGNNVDNENNSPQNAARLVAVETMLMEPGMFQDAVRLSGTVESVNDAVISSEASGRVEEILRRGTEVQVGDMVARLDETLLRASLDVARATYQMAEDAFQRQEPLFEEGIVTPLEFSQVRSQRDQARAQLQQAERQLENANITAPFNGRVEERLVDRGELLNPGSAVVRLVNTERVRVTAGVPERYAAEIGEGSPVAINLRAYGGRTIEAEVHFSGNVINAQSRTFPIEIEIDNTDRLLKPEMTVELSVVRSSREDAIAVPRSALVRDEYGLNVYTVNREGERPIAEFRPVETGRSTGGNVLILDGLFPGDEVVITGQNLLNEGDQLRVNTVWDRGDEPEVHTN